MTPARLAANAKKSTGPRTEAGKNRTRWNALKRGEYARSFRQAIIGMGENPRWLDFFFYDWISYKPEDAEEEAEARVVARDLWWQFIGNASAEVRGFFRQTNPESLLESAAVFRRLTESRQIAENKRFNRSAGPQSRQRIDNKPLIGNLREKFSPQLSGKPSSN